MELIIAFLLEKGGIYGLLFILSLTYIWWSKSSKKPSAEKKDEKKDEVLLKVDLILEEVVDLNKRVKVLESDLKTNVITFSEHNKAVVNIHELVRNIDDLINDLWSWHSVKDIDGLPIWYVKRSLEVRIQSLSDNMKIDADKLAQYNNDISKLNKERIDELKEVITNYNKTISDLAMALEKVRMTLDSKRSV